MDVLNRQARICSVEPDRSAVRSRREVDELLQVLPARRWRRVLREFKDQVEHFPDVLCEVGNVRVERTVIHGKETNLVVLERHELREVRRTDLVQVLGCPATSRAQQQFYLEKGKT